MDFWGVSLVVSTLRMKYFLLFVDDCTRYLRVKNHKLLKSFHFDALVLQKFNAYIKQLHNNSVTECKSPEPYLYRGGYQCRISYPYSPSKKWCCFWNWFSHYAKSWCSNEIWRLWFQECYLSYQSHVNKSLK